MSKNSHERVKIIDNKLILSLTDAEMPVVWQLDLEDAQSAGFTVEEDKRKKKFALLLKKSDGAAEEIALYKNKDDAVEILMETSDALQSAQGNGGGNAAVANSNSSAKGSSDNIGALLALSLIIILIAVWMLSASGNFAQIDGNFAGADLATTSNTPADARDSSGVPVSADDFLNSR